MPSWTDGYVTDIPYTSGFYRELSPVYLSYLCDIIGVRAPDLSKPYSQLPPAKPGACKAVNRSKR